MLALFVVAAREAWRATRAVQPTSGGNEQPKVITTQ
jgi:hypothetical protein